MRVDCGQVGGWKADEVEYRMEGNIVETGPRRDGGRWRTERVWCGMKERFVERERVGKVEGDRMEEEEWEMLAGGAKEVASWWAGGLVSQ